MEITSFDELIRMSNRIVECRIESSKKDHTQATNLSVLFICSRKILRADIKTIELYVAQQLTEEEKLERLGGFLNSRNQDFLKPISINSKTGLRPRSSVKCCAHL